MIAQILSAAWVFVLLVIQPLAAYRGRGRLTTHTTPRLRLYRGSAVGIAAIGLLSLLFDFMTSSRARRAVTGGMSAGGLLELGGTMVGASAALWVAIQLVRRAQRRQPSTGYLQLLPRTASERLVFAGVSLLAGVAEEFAFRGFCFFTLAMWTGSVWVAALAATAGFGLGHAYQGVGGILRTTAAGALLVAPVLATGTLLPSMMGHAALDLVSGLATYPVLRRWGLLGGASASIPTGASPEPPGAFEPGSRAS